MPPIRVKKDHSLANVIRDLDSSGSRDSTTFKNHKTTKRNEKNCYPDGAAFLGKNGGGDMIAPESSQEMGSIIKMYDNLCQDKYKKFDNISATKIQTSKEKMAEVLNKQSESRNELHNKFAKNLTFFLNQTEKDLQEHQTKQEALLAQYSKMAKDIHHTIHLKIEGMTAMLSAYKSSVKSMDESQKGEQEVLTKDVTENMIALHTQLATSSRKESLEHFKRTLLLVEGLLRSGGMRIEDRPLWWDVYRAFPPVREPSFSRPVPTNEIRQIFYEEDALRAKFHKSGQFLGTVTLADEKHKSHTQSLIDIHNKLSSENPNAGDELYDKCVDILQNEISSQKSDRHARNEQEREEGERSVSTMFSEAQTSRSREQTIKNIFKE